MKFSMGLKGSVILILCIIVATFLINSEESSNNKKVVSELNNSLEEDTSEEELISATEDVNSSPVIEHKKILVTPEVEYKNSTLTNNQYDSWHRGNHYIEPDYDKCIRSKENKKFDIEIYAPKWFTKRALGLVFKFAKYNQKLLDTLLDFPKDRPLTKIELTLLEKSEFQEHKKQQDLSQWIGGYTYKSECAHIIVLPVDRDEFNSDHENTIKKLAAYGLMHEQTHVAVSELSYDLNRPTWWLLINEGLATTLTGQTQTHLISPFGKDWYESRLYEVFSVYQNLDVESLSNFTELSTTEAYQAYAFAQFFVLNISEKHGEGRARLQDFAKFFKKIREGFDPEAAFTIVFKNSLKDEITNSIESLRFHLNRFEAADDRP